MDSFFLMGARPLVESSPRMKLHELLDWGSIQGQLKGVYLREITGAGGPEPYSPLGMFKLMLLRQWHGLSDAQLEQTLRVRLDFWSSLASSPRRASCLRPAPFAASATAWLRLNSTRSCWHSSTANWSNAA